MGKAVGGLGPVVHTVGGGGGGHLRLAPATHTGQYVSLSVTLLEGLLDFLFSLLGVGLCGDVA